MLLGLCSGTLQGCCHIASSGHNKLEEALPATWDTAVAQSQDPVNQEPTVSYSSGMGWHPEAYDSRIDCCYGLIQPEGMDGCLPASTNASITRAPSMSGWPVVFILTADQWHVLMCITPRLDDMSSKEAGSLRSRCRKSLMSWRSKNRASSMTQGVCRLSRVVDIHASRHRICPMSCRAGWVCKPSWLL